MEKITKKCKGIKNSSLKNILHEDYVNCNVTGDSLNISQETFKSQKHDLYSVETMINGAISRYDSKRQIDGRFQPLIYTVPWGYNPI